MTDFIIRPARLPHLHPVRKTFIVFAHKMKRNLIDNDKYTLLYHATPEESAFRVVISGILRKVIKFVQLHPNRGSRASYSHSEWIFDNTLISF